MRKLFLLEWRKLTGGRKLWAVLLATALLLAVQLMMAVMNENRQQQMDMKQTQAMLTQASGSVLADGAAASEQAKLLKQHLQALQHKDRAALSHTMDALAEQGILWMDGDSDSAKARYAYLRQNGIPVRYTQAEVNGAHFLVADWCSSAMPKWLIPILALLLAALCASKDRSGVQKLELQQPWPRWRQLLAKCGACSLLLLLVMVGSSMLAFAAGTAVGGPGDLRDLEVVSTGVPGSFTFGETMSTRYASLATILLDAVPMLLLTVFFFSAFGLLCAVLFMNGVLSLCISLLPVVLFGLLNTPLRAFEAGRYVPFGIAAWPSYPFQDLLVSQQAPLDYPLSYGVYFASTVVCLAMAILVFRKRDVTV